MKKNKLDGDIVVEEAKGKHKYGHVQIYNSKHDKWVSDFKQKGEAMVHSSDIGKRHYFRYRPKFPGISYGNEKDIINHRLCCVLRCYRNSTNLYLGAAEGLCPAE